MYEYTLTRRTKVWIVYRENLATGVITSMSAHLQKGEANSYLKSLMKAGYSKELGYVFTIEGFYKRVISTMWIKETGKEVNGEDES